MTQQHLDRLSSTDASFLHQEGPSSHMHIGALLLFEGPVPKFEAFLDHVRARLHLVPRYRQKLVTPPLETGRPLWIDDPDFNLEYHVRHTALPSPGSMEQLLLLTARIHSQQLDREKPLWEIWLVEGVEDSRFAMISKTHHALVDGISGVDLATVLFDAQPEPAPLPRDLEPWQPQPEPSPVQLAAAGVRGAVRTGLHLTNRALGALTRPQSTLNKLSDAAEGLGELAWAALNPAPETPLNVETGPHRRFALVRQDLTEYKAIKNSLGGTVNDVVLTVVSGALARWLRSRGIRTEGLEMRALVPVSVRTDEQRGSLGNRLAVMRGPLPVYIRDPVARLRFVKQAMDGLKESKQAVGAETLAAVNELAPPTILAQASRLNFSTRLFNLIVTNIPGPQLPLYVLGRELQDIFPIAFLPVNHALAVAIMSYNGGLYYGLLADYDAVADLDVIREGIQASLQELLQVAEERAAPGPDESARREKAAPKRRRRAPAATRPAGSAARGAAAADEQEAPAAAGDEQQAPAAAGDEQQAPAAAGDEQQAPAAAGDEQEAPAAAADEQQALAAASAGGLLGGISLSEAEATRAKSGPAADMRAKRARRRPRSDSNG